MSNVTVHNGMLIKYFPYNGFRVFEDHKSLDRNILIATFPTPEGAKEYIDLLKARPLKVGDKAFIEDGTGYDLSGSEATVVAPEDSHGNVLVQVEVWVSRDNLAVK